MSIGNAALAQDNNNDDDDEASGDPNMVNGSRSITYHLPPTVR
jgi:hypothetical protein